MIVFVSGLPGSGKSYFAIRLARIIDAEYINSDELRKKLFSKRTYSKGEKARVYDAMLQSMQGAMNRGMSVVLDATFHKKEIRNWFLQKTKGSVFFIEVWADEEITKERLKQNRPYSEADFGVYEIIRKQWEPLTKPHLTLQSTNSNIDEMLQKAMEYLKDDPRANR
ncbi:AAA family ATPase [Poritiphilus flavus]|uniref:AAA family ATPase n=1 Tax=Poritiphilus flavus TaxID=2697053 RepID=A0A6L9EHM9_9FLAO|nr:ATP-binding protein [Poritiphilus flavus]NAS13739.1 AAA family ATPase [Poritiphilus flavus]